MATITDIPTESRQKLLLVPRIGPDRRDMISLEELEPEYRARLRVKHEERVLLTAGVRQAFLKKSEKSASFRRALKVMCAKDIVFFVDSFVHTFDDRLEDPAIRFVTYPWQQELLRYYSGEFLSGKGRKTAFVEKSRATGYSWTMAAASIWSWLFREGDTTLWGAVLLDDIDNGGQGATLKSHFGRMRWIINSMPEWMVPEGIHSERVNKQLLLINPQRPTNVIEGRQFGANFGRGSRFGKVILDEIAHSPEFEAAMTSISQTTYRVFMGTTPKGRDTASARLRFDENRAKRLFTIHWTSNPTLDVEWYWEQARHMSPEARASELDLSYDLSAGNRIFQNFDPLVNVADIDYDEHLPLHIAMDPGYGDECAILWIQPCREDKTYRIVDHVLVARKTGDWFVPLLLGYIPQVDINREPWRWTYDAEAKAMIDRHGKWGPIDEGYGDQGGGAHTQISSWSLYDMLAEYGVAKAFGGILPVKHDSKIEAVQRAEIAMPRVRIARRLERGGRTSVATETIVDCFQQYVWVEPTSKTGREQKREPKHDVFSHAMDAWQFYLAGKEEDVSDPLCVPISGQRHLLPGMPDPTGHTGTLVPDYNADATIYGGP